MKISKYLFLKTLAKSMSKKLGENNPSESQLDMMATSMNPVFATYWGMMKAAGLVDSEERVNVNLFVEKVEQFFKVVPVLNIPLGSQTFQVTKLDVEEFIKGLERVAEVEEVICLPHH